MESHSLTHATYAILLLLIFTTASPTALAGKSSLIVGDRSADSVSKIKTWNSESNSLFFSRAGPAEGINLKDYGAVGDDIADDGPALQSALDALAEQGGGTLIVPNGKYALKSAVYKDFLNQASAIIIRGVGSASQFRVATPSATTLTLGNVESLLIENLTFVGTLDVPNDALIALNISSCLRATIRNCNFYGISSLKSGGAVVYNNNSDVTIEQSAFRGCTGNGVNGVPVIQNEAWRGLSVIDVDFIDYGNLNGVYYSKTPIAVAYAWIRMGNTNTLADANGQNEVRLSRVRMDEGAQYGFFCNPNYPEASDRIAHVFISGLRLNGSGISGSTGIYLISVDKVLIERSWIGYTQLVSSSVFPGGPTTEPPRTAIRLDSVGDAVIDSVRCEQAMNVITADSATRSLSLTNVDATIQSSAQATKVTKGVESKRVFSQPDR